MSVKTYHELITLPTFDERLKYLQLDWTVGEERDQDRIFRQRFYTSYEWKQLRNHIIARDFGRDLALEGYELLGGIYIHHLNPITLDDISNATENLLNPEFLVCCSFDTHQYIHYGISHSIPIFTERSKNDTCPWKTTS